MIRVVKLKGSSSSILKDLCTDHQRISVEHPSNSRYALRIRIQIPKSHLDTLAGRLKG